MSEEASGTMGDPEDATSSSSSRGRTQVAAEVVGDTLHLCGTRITFMRTLRIPDDGKDYPLPPGLGSFPVRRVSDYEATVPPAWRAHGGVFLPIYQREAMWLSFGGGGGEPNALKVAVGKVCAVTGQPWSEELHAGPDGRQDYVVVPGQPWLDGINSGDDTIRQFVAMPLGMGYTVEGQVTGEEKHGGLQMAAFRAKPGAIPSAADEVGGREELGYLMMGACPPQGQVLMCASAAASSGVMYCAAAAVEGAGPVKAKMMMMSAPAVPAVPAVPVAPAPPAGGTEMGLAAGGKMRQEIYADPHGVEVWDQSSYARVFVHLCNSLMWREITGEAPPETPVTAKEYEAHGFPWFELYDEGAVGVDASEVLAGVKSVKEMDEAKGFGSQQDDSSVSVSNVVVVTAGVEKLTCCSTPPQLDDESTVAT